MMMELNFSNKKFLILIINLICTTIKKVIAIVIIKFHYNSKKSQKISKMTLYFRVYQIIIISTKRTLYTL